MVYPFNTNKIEQLSIDPVKMIDGCIWFNTTDLVYKAYIDNTLHVFMTDKSFSADLETMVEEAIKSKHFVIEFTDANSIIIAHNKDSHHFNYQLLDTINNTTILTSIEIIDENTVKIDLVDSITGSLYMHFA
jgi:hypothetical protein